MLSYPKTGSWIWSDDSSRHSSHRQTCLLRHEFNVSEWRQPSLRVSADSRYILWLNGKIISRGPSKGTLQNYHYETVDLTGLIQDGINVLAAEVLWYGHYCPLSEIHSAAGFWCAVYDGRELKLVTDEKWRVLHCNAHIENPLVEETRTYSVVDHCDYVDMRKYPLNWETAHFDDSNWPMAVKVEPAVFKYGHMHATNHSTHELVPSGILPMEEVPFGMGNVVQSGKMFISNPPDEIFQVQGRLQPDESPCAPELPTGTICAGSRYYIIDMNELVTGFPVLHVECDGDATVELRYAEALSSNFKKTKRNKLEGNTVEGYFDTFKCRPGLNVIQPFVWRTFRFLRIAIHSPSSPLRLAQFNVNFTAYPLRAKAAFSCSDATLNKIWETSWRTARLCAHETYEDCPYYEQLQYIGDTRLQAMVSYHIAGEPRLAKKAIQQFAESQRFDGITLSRFPSHPREPQIIPNFSLIWIETLLDYCEFTSDIKLVKELFPVVQKVLTWFEQFLSDGVLTDVPYWLFTDWTLIEKTDSPSYGELNMRHISALKAAHKLAKIIKHASVSELQDKLDRCIGKCCEVFWDESRGLFCDGMNGEIFSEHPSLMAILNDMVSEEDGKLILAALEQRDDIARTSIYYSYYAFRAYEKLGDFSQAWSKYKHLWTDIIDLGGTTLFERSEPSRSDCHAWGTWIMCNFLDNILGVQINPETDSIEIKPHLTDVLEWASGTVQTKFGPIKVNWRHNDSEITFSIDLPKSVDATLLLQGSRYTLAPGLNRGAVQADFETCARNFSYGLHTS